MNRSASRTGRRRGGIFTLLHIQSHGSECDAAAGCHGTGVWSGMHGVRSGGEGEGPVSRGLKAGGRGFEPRHTDPESDVLPPDGLLGFSAWGSVYKHLACVWVRWSFSSGSDSRAEHTPGRASPDGRPFENNGPPRRGDVPRDSLCRDGRCPSAVGTTGESRGLHRVQSLEVACIAILSVTPQRGEHAPRVTQRAGA